MTAQHDPGVTASETASLDELMKAIRIYGRRPDETNERAIRSILQSALAEARADGVAASSNDQQENGA